MSKESLPHARNANLRMPALRPFERPLDGGKRGNPIDSRRASQGKPALHNVFAMGVSV